MKFRCALLLLTALIVARPLLAAEPIATTDLLKIRRASAIEVSKDGSKAVIAVQSIGELPRPIEGNRNQSNDSNQPPEYKNQSHLYLLTLARTTSSARQLTFGNRYDHSPTISPDGKWIAFVRGREDDADDQNGKKPQVWLMPIDGGEARQVTRLSGGARSPQFAPDSRTILITSNVELNELPGGPDWPLERPRREWKDVDPELVEADPAGSRDAIRAWLEENAADGDPVVLTRMHFQEEHGLRSRMEFAQLFIINFLDETAQPQRITSAFFDHDDATFLPGGDAIIYTARHRANMHPDRLLETTLHAINLDASNNRTLLAMDGWRIDQPKPSPDGSMIAFTAEQTDEPAYRQSRLGVLPLNGSEKPEPVWLTEPASFDHSVNRIAWKPASFALIFNAARQGGFPLMEMGRGFLAPTSIIHEQDGMPVGVHAFGVGAGTIVYALTTAANPSVLRVRDANGDRLVLDLNEWVKSKSVVKPTSVWITRPDGTRVQYWLMEPANRIAGQKYPVCLEIHGGPSAMWGPGEFTMWLEFQLLASWGYGVVYANPRGSGGYGYDFQRANFQNWGEGPGGDVLAALDHAVAMREWIDPKRLVVTGGSYGGYLTAWIVGHDHRFKAAVAQRGVYDLTTFFGEGNAWQLGEWAFGGLPWDPLIKPILQRESPFTYVNRIRTPLLIMHASNDLRTGVSQSEMLYRALKRLDKPVEYVRYPNAGHDLSRTGDPKQRMDRLNRIIEFFERFIDNPREGPEEG